jgi:hypothetical protein
MQFAPDINGDNLQVYDPHTLEILTYTKTSSERIGTEKLEMDKYESAFTGGVDQGFVYDLPYTLHSLGCGDCDNNTATQSVDVEIYSKKWKYAENNSTCNLFVQPSTGYT